MVCSNRFSGETRLKSLLQTLTELMLSYRRALKYAAKKGNLLKQVRNVSG